MKRRILMAAGMLGGATGCITINPHSTNYGQLASTLGQGNAEVGVTAGVDYERESSSNEADGQLTVPYTEGNLRLGLTDMLDLNVHLSPAGVQPGVKVGLVKGDVSVAVLPELAFAYMNEGASSISIGSSRGSNGSDSSSLGYTNLMAGLKVLVSHTSGVYGGVGYDYERTTIDENIGGGSSDSSSTVVAHNVSAAIGYSSKGRVMFRPELAVIWAPSQSSSSSGGTVTSDPNATNSFLVFLPSLTVVVGTGDEPRAAPPPEPAPQPTTPSMMPPPSAPPAPATPELSR